MSDDVVAAAETVTEPVAVEAPPAPAVPKTPKQELLDRLRAGREAAKAAREAKPAETPAAPAKEPTEAKDEKEPEPAKDEDKELELAYAKVQRKLADAQDELRVAREANKKAEAELKGLLGLQAGAKEDPVKALAAFEKLMGRSFGDFSKWIVDNGDKVKAARSASSIPDEYRTEIETLRAEREAREAEKRTAAEQTALVDYTGKVGEYLKQNADDFPLASQFEFAAQQLAGEVGVGKVRPEHIKAMEERLESNIVEVLTETTLRHLIKKNEKIRTVVAALSATAAPKSPVTASPKGNQSEKSDGPKTLSNASTSAAAVTPTLTGKEATRAALLDGLRKMREANASK